MMKFDFLTTLDGLITAVIYLLSSFVLFFIGKKVYQLLNKKIDMDHELVEKDNFSFAIANVGYYTGLIIAILAVFSGEGIGHIWENLMDVFIYGMLSIVLLNLSMIFMDKVVLNKFDMTKEIVDDQNAGTGVIQGASAIANGLIISGVLTDNDEEILDIVILWAVTQIAMVLVSRVYNWMTPYDIHEHIEKDNVAVGVGFAGAIIAIGNLIRFGASMEADSWFYVGENLLLETGIGLAMLPVARFMTDKILLPKRKLTDEIINQEKPNVGAAVIEAFAYIGGSVLICASFS